MKINFITDLDVKKNVQFILQCSGIIKGMQSVYVVIMMLLRNALFSVSYCWHTQSSSISSSALNTARFHRNFV